VIIRIVKWLLVAVVVFACFLAGGILGNRLPLAAPPGPAARISTYLNTHVAETTPDSRFPELRTRNFSLPADVLYAKVKQAVGQLPRWEIIESSDDRRELNAVVTTKLFRFKDDVTINVVPEPGGRPALMIRSTSRVGKGDLGANTRHVLDVYDALAAAGVKGGAED
jgi:uncharacterized protein (DUF1499 family)